jgi:hypothetical protein
MKQNETERNRMSFCFVLKWIEMEQIRTNTHGPFRSERSGAELEEEIKILKRKRFSISLLAQTERNGMGNGMEWNGMKQNETE